MNPPFCLSVLNCMLKDFPAEADAYVAIEFIYKKMIQLFIKKQLLDNKTLLKI